MIARSYIEATLDSLDKKYATASSQKESWLYSKLAILELCGWIEESMDDIVLRCAKRHLGTSKYFKDYREKYVDKVHGFGYSQHFRSMLQGLLGVIVMRKVEKEVDTIKLDRLKSTLGTLKATRDKMAHTHIRGTTPSIDAPSRTISNYKVVYDGLIEFQEVARSIRL